MYPRCPACRVDLSLQDSGDGPVVGLALITEVRYGLPVWLPLTMVLVLALMRPFKSVLIALRYKHRRHDFGERA